jgi:hypothetical protein
MPAAMARRVGSALEAAAQAQEARRFRSWWQRLWAPPLVVGLALAAALLLFLGRAPSAIEPAPPPGVLAQGPVEPAPPLLPHVQPPRVAHAATVSVTSDGHSAGGVLQRAQALSEGSVVSTGRAGSLWLSLHDGSRAGLTAGTEATLAELDDEAITLDLAKGSLAMVVPHRADRVLSVRAGDLQVTDLGTRFVVSRDAARVMVAVEEGQVEVQVPGRTERLTAGHAASWAHGTFELLSWELPRTLRPVEAPTRSPSRLAEEDASVPVVEEAPVHHPRDEADEAWVQPPAALTTGPTASPAQPVQPPPGEVAPSPLPARDDPFGLATLEKRLNEMRRAITSPFPFSGSMRATRAREIAQLADAGDCEGVLLRVEAWLRDPPSLAGEEPSLHRSVLTQKFRCLTRLGRTAEAEAVRAELDGR